MATGIVRLEWKPRGAPSKVRAELRKYRTEIFQRPKHITVWSGERIPALIRARMRRGLDVNDAPFARYTEAYAERRRKLGLSGGRPDLRVTGDLYDGIRWRGSGASGKVEIDPGERRKASGLQDRRRRRARVFLGVSPRDLNSLNKKVHAEIERRMRRTMDKRIFRKVGPHHFTGKKPWRTR